MDIEHREKANQGNDCFSLFLVAISVLRTIYNLALLQKGMTAKWLK